MKIFKKVLITVAGIGSLAAPLGFATVAHAAQVVVLCSSNTELTNLDERQICDLSIDKQVSVNGGAFVEADTSGDAANATIGDTVTWKITVSNNSTDGLTPHGWVYVTDVLPSGVSFNSYTASSGTYGVWSPNVWALPLLQGPEAGPFTTTLPATLTLTSTASGSGLNQNTAQFFKYDQGQCDGGCTYVDGDSTNDSNDAWINVSGKPVVLAESTTLPNTGSGLGASLAAGGLIAATAVVSLAGRRKPAYKFNR